MSFLGKILRLILSLSILNKQNNIINKLKAHVILPGHAIDRENVSSMLY